MALDTQVLLKRIDQLLGTSMPAGDQHGIHVAVSEALHGTLTLAAILYGDREGALQMRMLTDAMQRAKTDKTNVAYVQHKVVWPAVQGALRAMRGDVEAGLVGNIERRAAGEVIADMLGLAKEALSQGSEGAKNVAAVLAAAAFEDAMRRMGAALANVKGRPKLAEVLESLKAAGILVGAPFGTAQSYLKLRNDALHADWARLDGSVIGSCIAFVEQQILQHLS